MDGKAWIMTRRQKTNIESNVLLLDIPKTIITKYCDNSNYPSWDGKLFPILSNPKMNAYLKEIADLCGIKKNLTFHLVRYREFYKHQIIKWLYYFSIKGGNDKEASELLTPPYIAISKNHFILSQCCTYGWNVHNAASAVLSNGLYFVKLLYDRAVSAILYDRLIKV